MIDKLKMYWPFIVGFVIVFIIGGLLFFRYLLQPQNLSKPVLDKDLTPLGFQNEISDASSDSKRIQVLEQAVLDLAKQIGDLKTKIDNSLGTTTTVTGKTTTTTDLSSLVATVNVLQTEVNLLKQNNPTTVESNNSTPTYIPLGWFGTVSSTAWTGVTSQTAIIDTGNYPGYTSAQLEINLQMYQGNGTAYAQLFNSTTGLALLVSQVSSNNQNYTWVTSSPFQLSSGKNTYYIQLYSTTGYAVNLQDARIRINYN